ncbi:aminotransferase class V-fold PLP-dependent enzyme [Deminuibacter soli]|uniref:Aminotransferase class V-fold PLP-dependent enzyme n=1 Tax=Deminuibacter soli TaxID=2291815 RepID=A0A3E1NFR2_9BACT|nr:aminotransferase class V-fold PLP-dependent enzyme [Deminuibacter soli]RFM26816.1 aminotransferase class V-fold PLP-dependent enzyme [Deminuibacter soli]
MNILTIRHDTPGCADQVFLNSAGASLMPRQVVARMKAYLDEETEAGGYAVAEKHAAEIAQFYVQAARLINTQPENIAFAFSATEAYIKALLSIPFVQGDYIVTTNDDYASNQLAFLSAQQRWGVHIVRANNTAAGDIDLDHMEQLIKTHKPRLVAVTHVPTSSGLVQQAAAVGELCRRYNCLYLVDACQSVGQLPVDIQAIGCDFLTATGRKFLRGPRGTGFLYVSDRVLSEKLEPLYIDMRGAAWTGADQYTTRTDARRFETWELPYAALTGLTEAMHYAMELGLEYIATRNHMLSSLLRKQLATVPGVQVLDRGTEQCSIVTFTRAGFSQEQLEALLHTHAIRYSVTSKTSAQIDFSAKGIEWAIRLSPHYFNTEAEINRVSAVLQA